VTPKTQRVVSREGIGVADEILDICICAGGIALGRKHSDGVCPALGSDSGVV
jgi:hypothetical protein